MSSTRFISHRTTRSPEASTTFFLGINSQLGRMEISGKKNTLSAQQKRTELHLAIQRPRHPNASVGEAAWRKKEQKNAFVAFVNDHSKDDLLEETHGLLADTWQNPAFESDETFENPVFESDE